MKKSNISSSAEELYWNRAMKQVRWHKCSENILMIMTPILNWSTKAGQSAMNYIKKRYISIAIMVGLFRAGLFGWSGKELSKLWTKEFCLPVTELCILHQRERHFQKSTKKLSPQRREFPRIGYSISPLSYNFSMKLILEFIP